MKEERKRRILWLKSAIPYPLDQGMNFLTDHLFRLLRPQYEIEYVCMADPKQDAQKIEAVKQLVSVTPIQRPNRISLWHRLCHAAWLRTRQMWAYLPGEVYYQVPTVLKRAVREKMASGAYDLLFMEYWYFGELGDWLADFNVAALMHDNEMDRIESEFQTVRTSRQRRILQKKVDYVFRAHLSLIQRARRVFFFNDDDRRSFFKRASTEFPNVQFFPYLYQFGDMPKTRRQEDSVVFSGKMSYLPNIVAAQRLANGIWPAVRARRPEAKLILAGNNPPPGVRKLAEIPGVEVTGFVEDLRALVASAAVYVAPIEIGGGLKIKLMEAAELESAIVATPFAFRGFEVSPGRDFLPATTDSEFAEAIIRLLGSPQERAALGKNVREAVFRQFSSDVVKAKVLALFDELTRGKAAQPVC
jgi:glycosyltransferase involved in cell wall biosynthesis